MTKFLLGFFSFGWLRALDFLPPLLLRLLLAPMLWVSGSKKIGLFASSDTDLMNPLTWVDMDVYATTVDAVKSLPIPVPFPELAAWIIPGVEIAGAILLLLGFAVRWISIPLLLLVGGSLVLAVFGQDITVLVEGILMSHGYNNPETNGITQMIIYFIMFLTLFFMGAGRYFSIDWLLYNKLRRRIMRTTEAKVTLKNDPFSVNATNP